MSGVVGCQPIDLTTYTTSPGSPFIAGFVGQKLVGISWKATTPGSPWSIQIQDGSSSGRNILYLGAATMNNGASFLELPGIPTSASKAPSTPGFYITCSNLNGLILYVI